jgi:hypothetical protein
MQNNYDLNNVVLIYLAGPSKHNFMFFLCGPINNVTLFFFLFCPHKVQDKAHLHDRFFFIISYKHV